MNPQVPSIASISSAVVLLASMFFNIELVDSEVQAIMNAALVLIFAGASVWSWIKTRGLIKENAGLLASLAISRAATKAAKVLVKESKSEVAKARRG